MNKLLDLECLIVRSKQTASMAVAISDAIVEGPNAPQNFYDALSLLANLMCENAEELEKAFCELLEETKKEAIA